jgi:rhamnogalacturonyl hydrolase YesR
MKVSLAALALCLVGMAGMPGSVIQGARTPDPLPLDIARILAGRYPQELSVRYIPALLWSGALRLTALTGEPKWEDKARREMEPFVARAQATITEPYVLTNLAGHFAFADLARLRSHPSAAAQAKSAADFILPQSTHERVRFARDWTDDMFMATSLWAHVAAQTGDDKYASAIGRLLITYAERLQRPDGLFDHALDGRHAWGRGNGFAALALADALTYLPDDWADRARVLDIYRRQMRAMLARQTADGAWRQVVDDDRAYPELTVTAMTVTAMARGVRRGWLDGTMLPAVERGWQAVTQRVSADGLLRDVCPSTGAGATREHYLNRPAINGVDDRGAAMALVAALEIHELRSISIRGASPRRSPLHALSLTASPARSVRVARFALLARILKMKSRSRRCS